jgi:predicted permease
MRVDPGFDAANVLALNFTIPENRSDEEGESVAYRDRLMAQLADLPGVVSVAGTKTSPLAGGGEPFTEWKTFDDAGAEIPFEPEGGAFFVSPQYFATLGTRVLAGRELTARDADGEVLGLIVNQAAARRFWPGGPALGRRVVYENLKFDVVGVVEDIRTNGLARTAPPAMYISWTLAPRSSVHAFLRTDASPAALIPAVRSAIAAYDPELPIGSLQPLAVLVSADLAQPRFLASLLGVFAAVAVLLASLGIYGVIAYAVTLRAHEIGVRMALGAVRRDVVAMVVGQALRIAGFGIAAGVTGALWATRALSGVLYGVSTTDPLTFVAVPLLLGTVAVVAAALPARRAARVDPMVAFRNE